MTPRRSPARGLTLLELMIALAIMAVLGALAAPSYGAYMARQRVKAAAQHLAADIGDARHEALRRHERLRVNFTQGPEWCYAITVDSAARCENVGHPAVLKRVGAQDHPGVTIALAETVELDGRGDSSLQAPAQVKLISARGDTLLVRMSLLGRPSVCSPDGAMRDVPRC